MDLIFTLSLPRDEATVPLVRHLISDALLVLGVTDVCTGEVELALAEACTNVLKHVGDGDDAYGISVEINDKNVEIGIVDTGRGFDHASFENPEISGSAEGGRGILLMRAMVDDLTFVSELESGTIVHLVKNLDLRPDSVLVVGETARLSN